MRGTCQSDRPCRNEPGFFTLAKIPANDYCEYGYGLLVGNKVDSGTLNMLHRNRAISGYFMLGAFLVWQLLAMGHLLFSVHAIGPDGKICEVDPGSGERIPEDWGPKPLDGECPVLAQITSTNTKTSINFIFLVEDLVLNPVPLRTADENHITGEEIFMISPSNSPPHLS